MPGALLASPMVDHETPSRQTVVDLLTHIRSFAEREFADLKDEVKTLNDGIQGRDGLMSAHLQIDQLGRDIAEAKRTAEAQEKVIESLREAQIKAERDATERWWKLVLALAASGALGGWVSSFIH